MFVKMELLPKPTNARFLGPNVIEMSTGPDYEVQQGNRF